MVEIFGGLHNCRVEISLESFKLKMIFLGGAHGRLRAHYMILNPWNLFTVLRETNATC